MCLLRLLYKKMYSINYGIFLLLCTSYTVLAEQSAAKINYFLSDEYISRINSMQNSWKAGRNFDPTTSLDRIKRLLGELDPKDLPAADAPYVKTDDPAWPETADIPETFDARSKWGKQCPQISEILDQGYCGSCWAIAPSSAATDRYCISSKGKFKGRLSTQHVAFCCQKCGKGCQGGFSALAWKFFKRGIVTGGNFNSSDGCQPYSLQPCVHYGDSNVYPKCTSMPDEEPKCRSKCYNKQYSTPFKQDKKRDKNAYTLQDVESIQKDILAHGPLSVVFGVPKDFLNYKSGVFETTSEEFIGRHAVRVIGWGKENGKDYWLIANSWNQYWGDKGLFKIKRGSNECGIEGNPNAGVPRKYHNF